MLDIFNDDAFSNTSLTQAINLLPYIPRRIGSMGLFSVKNPRTHTVYIERKGTILSILESKPRGSGETTKRAANRRDILPVMLPYIPEDDVVLAADVQGIREFGTEDQMQMVSSVLNDKLTGLRNDHELTHEWHRIGAIKGVVLDGDAAGSELLNLFDVFNLTQEEYAFDLEGDGSGIKAMCLDIIAYIEDRLQGTSYDHVHAMVGNTFFQNLVNNDEVKETYNEQTGFKWGAEQQGTGTQGRGSNQVTFGDITFENYRGAVGSTKFVDLDKAHFFPVGVPDLFQMHFGPANTMSDANTPGKDVYVMQEPMKFDEGIELHSESNPLAVCVRPSVLVLGHAGDET